MIENAKKLNLQDLENELRLSTLDELQYIRARFCGPHNILLREKKYDYKTSQAMTKIVNDTIDIRSFEDIVLADEE